jgi:hypothetical protein
MPRKPPSRIVELTRHTVVECNGEERTLYFTFKGSPRRARSAVSFVSAENMKVDFDGRSGWFEIRKGALGWQAIRQVPPPS